MNALTGRQKTFAGALPALAVSLLLLSACASQPTSPDGSIEVRNKLTALQNDPELSERARVELREAEQAVQLAERPLPDSEKALASHRIYMADRRVEIARATAATKLAEDQRAELGEQRGEARLQARTREADRAHADAAQARSSEADMQRRLAELEAKETERGMVVTLGDVLFDTGSAQLRDSTNSNLDKLVSFLDQYPDQRALIEGHTDNVGSADYNQRLSLQRAESVKQYLTQRGITANRLSASGFGLQRGIASNDTAAGRQQNRRVEIVIEKD
ncbi:OmpA family protein [Alcanivorax sp. JB21]|uniref:OmpA family protein n=1 Tax=Alcanivorax limicola TaxID=2874102 RepID=UPI001CBF63C4|nr:OmpA family protein [Alcanivorax limicola]MBZ2190554.1 OmpA family protein [Alcanivorax limicola]